MTEVAAYPSKSFFVSTLTRDIELNDAILDLLDNCVDGILRRSKKYPVTNNQKPYEGYWAKIKISKASFSIEDNCGGISKEVAEKSAFRLGRINSEADKDIPTVGMYGIGMKRAIFKMGKTAMVFSRHEEDSYVVQIPKEWLSNDDNWLLSLDMVDRALEFDGTSVIVEDLYENISKQFDGRKFIDDLLKDIANFFAIFIDKGFSVFLNDVEVKPADFRLLLAHDFESNTQIQPCAYQANIDGVSVKFVVGFYRELPKIIETEATEAEEQEIPTRKSDNAGWTVICNDRVVVYRDKTRLTGWGVRDVPKFHTQFIAISGVVYFHTNESSKLPLTSTKRNLDTSSAIYGIVLERMMDGLKQFTNFTNRWKGREEETAESFKKMRLTEPVDIVDSIQKWSTVRGSGGQEQKFVPILPEPSKEKAKSRIAFFKSDEEIKFLSDYIFGDPSVNPSEVGERCFDDAFKSARGEK